jgi:uncharacterized Zn finger protein (UPF0148 family)
VKGSSLSSGRDSLVCPLCEVGELQPFDNASARCDSCGGLVSGAMLETLRHIIALPDALGAHACEECGYPQMRLLPDGTFHCPSCGSEVLPLEASREPTPEEYRSKAYRCGWIDGRVAEIGCFTENPNLAKWQDANDRLNYYKGHRAGSEARKAATGARIEKDRERLFK